MTEFQLTLLGIVLYQYTVPGTVSLISITKDNFLRTNNSNSLTIGIVFQLIELRVALLIASGIVVALVLNIYGPPVCN